MSDTTDISDIIHHSSLELLKFPGVRLHDREILEQLKKYGARIENDMAMFTLGSTYMNRTDLTIHGAGILAGFAAFSYEQFMLDLELIQVMERTHRECSFSKDALVMDVIRQVGPGGEFLTHVHTMKHCRSEPYVSQLAPIKNDNPLQYLTDLGSNLNMSLLRLEQAYEKPDLDQTLQRDMDVYMAGCGVPAAFLEKIV